MVFSRSRQIACALFFIVPGVAAAQESRGEPGRDQIFGAAETDTLTVPEFFKYWSGSALSAALRSNDPLATYMSMMSQSGPLNFNSRVAGVTGARAWMSTEVTEAWAAGYTGAGASITVVDSVEGGLTSSTFTGARITMPHGLWTATQASLVAPGAAVYLQKWDAVSVIMQGGFNVFNLSYGAYARSSSVNLDLQSQSLVTAANGLAVVVKAAGNGSSPVGYLETAGAGAGSLDVLNVALASSKSAIIVGALASNGTPEKKAVLASYSNFAGPDAAVQQRFLTVGVDRALGLMAGTSFAAPIVSGYSAIVSSKFTSASPEQVVNQLLGTARTDTVKDYNAVTYGRGEASLSRALSPTRIN